MKNLYFLFAAALLCYSCVSENQQKQDDGNQGTDTAAVVPAGKAQPVAEPTANQAKGPLYGTFVFAQPEPGESHRLVIPGEDSRELPVYYGSESNSGEGIHFYATPVFDMEIDAAGNLSFTIGERQLYAEPVTDIQNKPKSDSGFSREELHYKGRFVADGIELTCQSETDLCWEEKMLFKRQ